MGAEDSLLSWLVSALTAWTLTPRDEDARALIEQARTEVASEVMTVAYDPKEPPLYKGPEGRAKTAILLEVIAAWETRLSPHVRAGQCKAYECDANEKGGHDAVGLMQLHVGKRGLELTKFGYRSCMVRDANCLHESDLVRNETVAVRLALHKLRQDGLASYLGEPVAGPVTEARKKTAREWLDAHPVPTSDKEQLAAMAHETTEEDTREEP